MKYRSIQQIIEDLKKNPSTGKNPLYHPIPYPEFEHLKTSSNRKEFNKKWLIINKFLNTIFNDSLNDLNILDIGANAGFFTFKLSSKGVKVESFEPNTRYSDIGMFGVKKSLSRLSGIAMHIKNPFSIRAISMSLYYSVHFSGWQKVVIN